VDEEAKIANFKVNDFEANNEVAQWRLRVGRGLVPTLVRAVDDNQSGTALMTDDVAEAELFEQNLLEATNNLFPEGTAKEARLATLRKIRIGLPLAMLNSMREIPGLSFWNQLASQWTLETPMFRNVRNCLLAKAARELLVSMNLYVSHLARSVHYFQPVRASVQRDYLSRDVEVGSVDPSGVNVAMVLFSLGNSAQQKFREWMSTHFGFEVFPKSVSDGARVALRMKETSSGMEFNLADMGFGFSQMLPFLLEIWNLVEYQPNRRRARPLRRNDLAIPPSYLIAIEQPELHLHPALHARLADLFVTMAGLSREKNVPVRFFLETHSPTIIERIGQLIEAQRLKPEDVQVLLFERGRESHQATTATVRPTHYDSKGVLQDWPFGFLSPPPDSSPGLPSPSTPPQAES
jgi:hypothetical protein